MKLFALLFLPLYFSLAGENGKNNNNDQHFSLSLSSQYSSVQLNRGVNISGTNGTLNSGFIIEHSNGFSFSYFNAHIIAGGTLSNSLGIGYTYEFNEFLYSDIDFQFTSYPDKAINPNAEFPLMLALSINADVQLFDFSVSMDKYFGNGAPLYFNVGVSKLFAMDEIMIMPLMDIAYISQEIDYVTAKYKSKSIGVKKTGQPFSSLVNVSGVSGVILGCAFRYNLGKDFALRFLPQVAWTPKQEISDHSTQISASIGISYSTEF